MAWRVGPAIAPGLTGPVLACVPAGREILGRWSPDVGQGCACQIPAKGPATGGTSCRSRLGADRRLPDCGTEGRRCGLCHRVPFAAGGRGWPGSARAGKRGVGCSPMLGLLTRRACAAVWGVTRQMTTTAFLPHDLRGSGILPGPTGQRPTAGPRGSFRSFRAWVWGLAHPASDARKADLLRWLDWFNRSRPHFAINRQSPRGWVADVLRTYTQGAGAICAARGATPMAAARLAALRGAMRW